MIFELKVTLYEIPAKQQVWWEIKFSAEWFLWSVSEIPFESWVRFDGLFGDGIYFICFRIYWEGVRLMTGYWRILNHIQPQTRAPISIKNCQFQVRYYRDRENCGFSQFQKSGNFPLIHLEKIFNFLSHFIWGKFQ